MSANVHVNADAGVHPGARRMFGVKDLFTVVNALAGVAALALCAEGHWLWACYAVAVGYAADMVDGSVARALREANRFGAEFDTAADFVTQAVAPALIVYLAYRDAPAALGLSPGGAQALGVWDALTADRAYRPAWDPERAITHIAGGAGILFDPECVEAFLDVMTEPRLFANATSADVEAMFRESLERHRTSAGS